MSTVNEIYSREVPSGWQQLRCRSTWLVRTGGVPTGFMMAVTPTLRHSSHRSF